MRTFCTAVLFVVTTALAVSAAHAAEMTWTYAVQATATVNAEPARIELNWTTDPFPVSRHVVHRKRLPESTWGEGVTLPGDATGFVDENVELGGVYEYQIIRHAATYTAYGYVAAGINAPLVEARGKVVLIVDRSIAGPVSSELGRLRDDLVGDGWMVVRKEVDRDESPAAVKALIKAEWQADKSTRAVLLLGRVPIVRSGNQNVDGHGARPMPADVFYGELDGEWTDANGDGIYDHNTIPSDVELQVGRIDFADLPGRYSPVRYPDEVELLRRYLDKNNAFRHAVTRPAQRALVGNAIGDANGQAYAASAYRTLGPLVGPSNVVTVSSDLGTSEDEKWSARVAATDYLWAYGCGAGSDFTIGGLGAHGTYADLWASDLIEKKAKATFYTFFGSWFADWSKSDNLLRTALAAPEHGLAASWSGRPHLFYHHLGMGETVGYGIRTSQNNGGLYQNQVQRQLRGVHIALMGDPTLRMHQLAPPREPAVGTEGNDVVVSWKPSRDTVLGYHVYRAPEINGPFTRITEAIVTDTRFADTRPNGDTLYMVRAIALHAGPSGSLYHASQGVYASSGAAAKSAVDEASSQSKPTDQVWFDDSLPVGAVAYASENDHWNWAASNPAPLSGQRAHQSAAAPGLHQHFFAFAAPALDVKPGDTLFTYVFLDPAHLPRQIMVSWLSDGWEHRAYWGENIISEGADATAGRRYLGPLPPAGRWVRLEVPASLIDLEDRSVIGMGFTLFDGRAAWDRAGKSRL